MKKKLLSILLALTMLIGVLPMSGLTASAKDTGDDLAATGFDPNNYKGQITKISVKEPYTKDGITYLPMEVNFHVNEDISDSNAVYFMEGYNNVYLADGRKAESLPRVGMTLIGPMKPDVPLEWNNQFIWKWNGGEDGGDGTVRYDVPMAADNDPQEITESQATGLTEVSGVKPDDKIGLRLETVMNSSVIPQDVLPPGGVVVSDEAIITIEDKSKYPKEITVGAVDDKTVAPPAEVVLPYTGQPQACPYTDQAGYYVTLNDPETDAGIYTAVLLLRDGYKWTDGSTEGKPAIWAINKAAITSVTLQHTELTYNTEEQQPGIASVMADSLTVPADGYTVSYSETPLYAGKYTLTVKGKGNFTGSASAEFEIFTVTADTCNHVDYNWRYEDNKDGKTHKVFCWNCGGCLNNSESHQIVYDAIHNQDGEPIGVYNPRCVHCGYEGDSVFCNHTDELEYTDNGLGTHKVTCKRCKKVVAEKESHKIVTTPIATNVGGVEAYLGQFTYSCEKCDYRAEFTCDHKNTGRIEYTPQNTSYPDYTHIARCAKCLMLLVDDQEACTSDGSWEPSSLTTHTSHCSICGQVMTGYHDFKGTRKITKFEATPYKGGLFNLFTRYNYRCYYTETCKVCEGVRQGYFDYPIIDVERWADYRAAFESIVKMNPEELQSFSDHDYLEGNKYYLLIPSWFLSPLYEATGTNEMNFANLQSGWLNKLTNTDEAGSCKMFDKNGKEIASYKPKDKKSVVPTGSDELAATGDDEGISEDELDTWRFTEEDGAVVALSTDYLMSLEDGEYSYTACFSNENGQTAAITMVFNIVSDDNGKKVTNLHPLGTMVNSDGGIVSMNLSDQYVPYTGEPITPPAVTLTSEMGVEYAEGEDYTLSYYQVVDGADGETIEVEIAKEDIKDIGTYNIVAMPTRNGVLSGEAWAQFSVVEALPKLLGDVDGSGTVDTVDVTFIQRHLLSIYIPFDFDEALADVDGEDGVNIVDVTWLQRWLVHMNAPKGIGQPIPDPDDISRSSLTGVWAYVEDENFVYTFNANGTGSYEVYGETINFTYTDNGTSVEIVFDDAPGTFDYTVDGNTLILVDSTGTDVRYIKQ